MSECNPENRKPGVVEKSYPAPFAKTQREPLTGTGVSVVP